MKKKSNGKGRIGTVRSARRAQMKVSKDKKPTSKANGRASAERTPSAPQTRQPHPADALHRLSKQASTPQKPDERSPEPIAAQANTFTMIIGALTSVFVLIKAFLEVRAARVGGMLAGGSLLCILISLAVSPLIAPYQLMPWGETESLALVLQIAFS